MTETALTKAVKKAAPSKEEGARTASSMEKAVRDDPVLMNELGQEPWWASGVQWTGSGGILMAIVGLLSEIATNGFDTQAYNWGVVFSGLGGIVMGAGVLYRRFVPGLRPVFWRWIK